ncbi:class I SAM-dependent methyltransferase [Paenibacillus gansuensis]|uniref:Class I SAM-dependent methyltransferase n=1 Tax=Paenibacillus gansuensis TaxID=306542 RepID=A0ABW5PI81_9BACL
MFEQLGNVKINLSYFTGENNYSDGPIEDELLEIVQSKNEINVLKHDHRWPVLYHLSPTRENLLEWFEFNKDSSVLEIGAGCGALTGILCQRARRVTCVELSHKRSLINATRNNYSNLEIIVGNLNDISFHEKFDYITLIGVLEYAGKFTVGDRPYHDFLEKIRSLLKPGGTLILAIENRLGIKYWAGANEDHTNVIFDGIEGYPNDLGVKTFTKKELSDLMENTGFSKLQFYYPFPDYKLPTQVFAEGHIPAKLQMPENAPNYDSERIVLFNEKLAIQNLVNGGMAEEFANSFLVICEN